MTQLGESLQERQRAILLTCFIYDNPGFKVSEPSTNYQQVQNTVRTSINKGVELWQANFKLTKDGVSLDKYFPLDFEDILTV